MKKFMISLAVVASALMLSGCGTTGSSNLASSLLKGASSMASSQSDNTTSSNTSSSSSSSSSLLGNLLEGVLGSGKTISQKDLVGTWQYESSDCVFESENLLMKAGGAVAASKVESELNSSLAKIGIKEGACSFTFNDDNTYTAVIGGHSLSGKYTLNADDKKITMTYLLGMGSMTPHIVKSGSKISLLIEGDKLLSLVKGISALSNSTTLSTVSSLLSQYDGLLVGMQLSK